MKRLMCLVLLVLVLSGQLFAESNQDLLKNMRGRINSLEMILIGIENELSQISLYSDKISKMNEQLQRESVEEQRRLQSRIDFLKAKKSELEEEKKKLEKDSELLSNSEETWTALKRNWKETEDLLEGQIRLWRGIAIGTGVATVAVITYFIISEVKRTQ